MPGRKTKTKEWASVQIPREVHSRVAALALREHRSLNAQVLVLLDAQLAALEKQQGNPEK